MAAATAPVTCMTRSAGGLSACRPAGRQRRLRRSLRRAAHRPATGSCRATGQGTRCRYGARGPAPPPPRRRSRPAWARNPAGRKRSRSRRVRRWPGHHPRSAPPGPAGLPGRRSSSGSTQQPGKRTAGAPARCRAGSRGPRPPPRAVAQPGTRRRSRRAAPQHRRRRGRRADQGRAGAVLKPDPHRLQDQPGGRGGIRRRRPPAGSRRSAGPWRAAWGRVTSGRARSPAASVWSSHRYQEPN